MSRKTRLRERNEAQRKAGEESGGTNVGDPNPPGSMNTGYPEPWRKHTKGGGIGVYYAKRRER